MKTNRKLNSAKSAPLEEKGRRHPLAIALSGIGQTVGTVGILLVMMVVWELWWTDLGAAHRQENIVTELGWSNTIPVATTTDPAMVVPATPPALVERTDEPPVMDPVERGVTFAVLYVPAWGEDYARPITEGVSRQLVLDPLGIGHYPSTGMPGSWGNFAIAAHRTTYGKPFERIEELEVGDALVVRTEDTWYVYHVTQIEIVAPDFIAAVAPLPDHMGATPDGRYITLTTCHPRYSAAQRYVVHGELEYWAPADAGYPAELLPTEEAN